MNFIEAGTRIECRIFNRLAADDKLPHTSIVLIKTSNKICWNEGQLQGFIDSVYDNLSDFYEKNFDKE